MKVFSLIFGMLVSISAFAQPTASFTVSDNVICEGVCIDIVRAEEKTRQGYLRGKR